MEEQGRLEAGVEGISESVTLASKPLGDSPGCLAGFGELCSCEAAWAAWGRRLLSLCHILFLRQTDSFAHWNTRAGGAAVKTNTWQLTGRLWPVFWGLPGPSTPQPQWVPWLEPRKERVGLSLCCLEWASSASWVFFTKAVFGWLLAGQVCSPGP